MKALFAAAAVVLLSACASAPFTTSADFDPEIDFSAYETYAWVGENPMIVAENSNSRPSPLLERRIMQGIETEMQLRGITQVSEPANADFVVAFTVGTREQLDIESYPTPIGFNTWGSPYGGWNTPYGYGYGVSSIAYAETTRTTQYTEGTLSIDIFDVENRRPVWHGAAQGVVKDRDQEEQRAILAQAIQEILATFPPL